MRIASAAKAQYFCTDYCPRWRCRFQTCLNHCTLHLQLPCTGTGGILRRFVTVRKRSCGKVMFSQVCVKNSVHGGGGVHPLGRHPPDRHTPPASRHPTGWQTDTSPLHVYCKGRVHPTGMHTCSWLFLLQLMAITAKFLRVFWHWI